MTSGQRKHEERRPGAEAPEEGADGRKSAKEIVLLGGLVLAANSFRKRVQLRGLGLILAIVGWSTFASGALISFAGFLLGSQVMCSCPASGPCACFVPLYNVMFYAGFFAALVGVASTVAGTLSSRRRRGETGPTGAKSKIGKKTVAATIALTNLLMPIF